MSTERGAQLSAVGSYAGRTLIIVNPKAGQESLATLRRKLGGSFAAREIAFDLVPTEYSGHATILAQQAAELGYRGVCVVGGDGTIAEAATGLVGYDVPLGIIPRGTANQVAQNLKIPRGFEKAIDVAVNGLPTPIDLGQVNGKAFALVAGAGFDAAVMQGATRELKERWGFGAYIYAALKQSFNATPARFCLTTEDTKLEVSGVSVMIANVGALFTKYIPLRFPLTPKPLSSWNDGLFDIVVVAPQSLPDWATVLWNAARMQFGGSDRLIHLQARRVTIESDPVLPTQIDGDPIGNTPITATVLERGVRVMMPL